METTVVVVNGLQLTGGQAKAVQCALFAYRSYLMANGLGNDAASKTESELYAQRTNEVLRLLGWVV